MVEEWGAEIGYGIWTGGGAQATKPVKWRPAICFQWEEREHTGYRGVESCKTEPDRRSAVAW